MFEQTIALIEEKLGMTPEEREKVEFNEENLRTELDIIKNIKGSILEMEVADEDQEVDPMNTLKEQPNILFFKDTEAGFLNAAIQSKKLIDQLINLNVPKSNGGFDLGQILGNLHPQSEDGENPEVVAENEDVESESVIAECKVQEVDEINKNGTIYDSEVVESEITESNKGENTEE